MSFIINLEYNASDTNELNKTITPITSVTGTLKNKTSIINPVIVIEGNIPTNCNYMTIPVFNRKYFITDIQSVNNDMFEVSAHVDVISTYAESIKNCQGIIARQQHDYNLYVDDGSFKVYQNPTFKIDRFPNGFNACEFVLAVAGG